MGIWLETNSYPKDGFETIYLPMEGELPLELVLEDSILNDYVKSGTNDSYIQFLENFYMANKKWNKVVNSWKKERTWRKKRILHLETK